MAFKLSYPLFVIMFYVLMVSAESVEGRSATGNIPAAGSSGGIGLTVPRRGLLLAPHTSRYGSRFADGFIIRDDDVIELTKKQFDDYGHMRFGKREDQFDDYGHLRFGRADTD